MSDFIHDLTIQTWLMFAIAVLSTMARVESRRLLEGSLKKLWLEEYIILFVLVLLAVNSWVVLEVAENGSNYVYLSTPDVAAALGPAQRAATIYGSKMTAVLEYLTLTILWVVKLVLCMMFHRLTAGLPKLHTFVKFVAVYCVLAYVLIVVLFSALWCRPFSGYWALPVKSDQCATYYHHMYFATAWNITADLALLAIPIKIIPNLQIPLRRKIMLMCVLGLGVFNILAAVLNRYYNFAHPNSVEFLRWYVGEFATAIYVINIPACWPVFRKFFPWITKGDTTARVSNQRLESHELRSGASMQKEPNILSESEENLAGPRLDGWPGRSVHTPKAKYGGGCKKGQDPLPNQGVVVEVEVSQKETYSV